MKLQPILRFARRFSLVIGLLITVLQSNAATIIWTNQTGGNLLWSNPANWLGNTVPLSTDLVTFTATNSGNFVATNVLGAVNSIVDSDMSVAQLFFDQVAPAYHTVRINPGITLTLQPPAAQGDVLGLRAGVLPNTTQMYTTIRGNRLVINSPDGSSIRINGSSTTPGNYWSTIDMRELESFECTTGEVRIGATGSSGGTQGTWILAKTNLIVLSSTVQAAGGTFGLALGTTTSTTDFSSAGDVQLGQQNVLRLFMLRVGGASATNTSLGGPSGGYGAPNLTGAGGMLEFQTGLNNPTLTVRGIDGVVAAETIAVGDNAGSRANALNTATGVMDLTTGTVDILVNNLAVGRNHGQSGASSTRAGSGIGTLTWTAGAINCLSNTIGSQVANNPGSATGVVNVRSNATLRVQDLSIGRDLGSSAGTANGTLNIVNGGQVTVTNSLREDSATVGGTSRVSLTNGTLTVGKLVRVDNFTAQNSVLNLTITPTNTSANPVCDITNLTFASAITLNVSGSSLTLASYPVFKYKGTLGGDGFAALVLASAPPDTAGYLFHNTANKTIDLVITNVPAVKWNATVNNDWNITGTSNWINTLTALPATYNENAIPGDPTIFDDTPVGASHLVNVTTVVSPALVVVNNTEPYTFIGTGRISGPTALLKSGSGTLDISTSGGTDYTGATTVNAGTLLVNSTLVGSSAVIVQSGATLGGNGTISSPVTTANGAILAPGNNGIGTLTFNGTLVMAAGSSNIFDLNSDTLANDQVQGFAGITYGGLLQISLSGSGTALTNGAAIQLFPIAGSGSFAGILPVNPAPGMAWDTNTLALDGIIRILTIPDGDKFIWTNVAGGNLLWSNPANWIRTNVAYAGSLTPNAVPSATDKVSFVSTNNGTVAATNVQGAVNNIVSVDTTVASLFYTPEVPAYHTTLINPGVTLSVLDPTFPGGDFFGVRVALSDTGDTNAQVHAAIRGAGRLVVGNTNTPGPAGHYMRIMASMHPPGAYWATFDMAGLNYLECTLGEIRVGSSGTSAGTHGTWRMAKTNLIVLGQTTAASGYLGLSIGHVSTSADYTGAGDVQLGQENVLQLAALTVGGARATNHTLGGPGGGVGGASLAGAGGTMEFQTGLVNPTVKVRGIDGFSATGFIAIGDNSAVGATVTTNTATGVFDLTGGIVDILATDIFVGRHNSNTTSSRNGGGDGTLTWTAGLINASTVTIGSQTANNLGTSKGVVNVRSNALLEVTTALNLGGDAGAAAGTGNGTLNITHGGVASVASVLENNVGAQSGSSTINLTNGYLFVPGSFTVDNLNVISGAVSNLSLATIGSLRGNGTVAGPVIVMTNLAPGAAVGTLSVFNDLTLDAGSTSTFEVNLDNLTNDKVVGLNNVTFNGTLSVTSLAGTSAVTNGTTLQLFNAASYLGAFTATNLPVLGGGWGWDTSELATGKLKVVGGGVNTTPTNLTFAVTGNQLKITWPSTHTGWRLQAQTNAPGVGLSPIWFTVPGSASTNHVVMPVDSAKGSVFYRLIYP